MYTFRNWQIQLESPRKLKVMIDQAEETMVVFDENKEVLVWISEAEDDGVLIQRSSWELEIRIFHEKRVLVLSTLPDEFMD